jgi:O-antigen chain-terminating methyltransferase
MLRPNNTDISTSALNEKVQSISTNRWRKSPLFPAGGFDAQPQGIYKPSLSSEHKLSAATLAVIGLIRKLPLVGTLAVFSYRRARQLLAPGLHWKQRIALIPGIGPLATWAYSVAMLSSIRQQIETELIQLRHYERAVKNTLEQMNARIANFEALQVEQRLQTFEALQIRQRLETFDAIDISQRLARLDSSAEVTNVGIAAQNNRIASLTRELRAATEAARLPSPQQASKAEPVTRHAEPVKSTANDSFYIDFEDAFRGTREDISERLRIYLPYLEKFIGDSAAEVVDVGCGRGEWLALLGQQGLKATGIDLNQAMVDTCRAQGLHAQCMDAIQYLSQQPPGSLVAVTGFHIIEHLPFDTLLALFDSALRALRPDGIVIFETPNPENLVVGACNFYTDPTHRNPIVPTVAEFIARQRGFAHAQILRLHPYPDSHCLVEDSEVAKRFNNAFYGPQDFAVLAWKTHEI